MEKYLFPDRKRIPYGMMNFALIRHEDYYYVDKTHFIPQIEQADRFFFFIRPRRFGKSLTLNMLQHYYDVRTKDKFDELFVHGFTLAMAAQNRFYRPISEQDTHCSSIRKNKIISHILIKNSIRLIIKYINYEN
ncbi:AAA family ATPase [uncultured Bacteroides sp.]|uniref:AAA family ATPase n=1 Tax=uncultured Bacteroides sp. TaxID=162156 RepID=UPI0025DEAF9A|nr:AAA family ATPase [uncultured Bacteroides sp.]